MRREGALSRRPRYSMPSAHYLRVAAMHGRLAAPDLPQAVERSLGVGVAPKPEHIENDGVDPHAVGVAEGVHAPIR